MVANDLDDSMINLLLENLPPIPLLGNLDALKLWPWTYLCLISWFPLILVPRWQYTPLVSLISPILMAIFYTLIFLSIIFLMEPPDPNQHPTDMFYLRGVLTIFRDPTSALGCWIHYLAFDPLVGRWIVLDSIQRGSTGGVFHYFVMVPVLLLSLFLGPMGWLLYIGLIRPIFLPTSGDASNTNQQKETIKAKLY